MDWAVFEEQKYRHLWQGKDYQGPNAVPYAQYLSEFIHGKCLDVGCGDCATMNELNKNKQISCSGLDITVEQCKTEAPIFKAPVWSMPFKNRWFEFTLSTDVLEHLPTEYIEPTLIEIARVTRSKTFHYISTRKAVTEYQGEQVHLTVKPREWWHDQFEQFCKVEFELKFW